MDIVWCASPCRQILFIFQRLMSSILVLILYFCSWVEKSHQCLVRGHNSCRQIMWECILSVHKTYTQENTPAYFVQALRISLDNWCLFCFSFPHSPSTFNWSCYYFVTCYTCFIFWFIFLSFCTSLLSSCGNVFNLFSKLVSHLCIVNTVLAAWLFSLQGS